MSAGFTEDHFVEQAAIQFMQHELGVGCDELLRGTFFARVPKVRGSAGHGIVGGRWF